MKDFYSSCADALYQDGAIVVATILTKKGSAPRTAGTKMMVREDKSFVGTIGGGKLEAEVLRFAEAAFLQRMSTLQEFEFLGEDAASTDMICGGKVTVLIEYLATEDPVVEQVYEAARSAIQDGRRVVMATALPVTSTVKSEEMATGSSARSTDRPLTQLRKYLVDAEGNILAGGTLPSEWQQLAAASAKTLDSRQLTLAGQDFFVDRLGSRGTVYLFGAGHVSRQVARLTAMLDFRTVVIDDREAFANKERFPQAEEVVVVDDFANAVKHLSVTSDSYFVIVSRGHLHDQQLLRQALQTPAVYIGMIGSRRKRDLIYQSLKTEGITVEELKRVHAPIGIPIDAETPEEIAVSIAAELIAVRRRHSHEQ